MLDSNDPRLQDPLTLGVTHYYVGPNGFHGNRGAHQTRAAYVPYHSIVPATPLRPWDGGRLVWVIDDCIPATNYIPIEGGG